MSLVSQSVTGGRRREGRGQRDRGGAPAWARASSAAAFICILRSRRRAFLLGPGAPAGAIVMGRLGGVSIGAMYTQRERGKTIQWYLGRDWDITILCHSPLML